MKKFSKILLITAAGFLAAGSAFTIAGATLGGTKLAVECVKGRNIITDIINEDASIDQVSEGDMSVLKYTSESQIKEIELDLKYEFVLLEPGNSDKVEIYTTEKNQNDIKVEEEKNKIKIKGGKCRSDNGIKIVYPENVTFDDISMDLGASLIEIQGELKTKEMEINVGAGSLENSGALEAKEMKIEVGAGSVVLDGVTADKIDAECGLGELNLTLQGKKEDYNYNLKCGMGAIQIGGEEVISFSGDKKINHSDASKNVELECGMGEINVDF